MRVISRLAARLPALLAPLALLAQAPLRPAGRSHAIIPAGTYATILTRADFPPTVGPRDVADMLGRWTFTFDRVGRYTVDHDTTKRVIGGQIRTSGHEIHFAARDIRDEVCHVHATYTVAVTSDALRFHRLRDACEVRAVVLTAHPLTRM